MSQSSSTTFVHAGMTQRTSVVSASGQMPYACQDGMVERWRSDLLSSGHIERWSLWSAEHSLCIPPARTMSAVCFSKKLNWSYEQEWRALTWRREEIGRTHSDVTFFPEALESVTFGARSTSELIKTLAPLVRAQYSDAKLYQIQTQQERLIKTLLVA